MRTLRRRAWFAAGLLVAALLGGCGAGEERVFETYESPSGDWTLRVTVAESRMPQGPFHIGADLVPRAGGEGTRVLATTLVNDGVPFTRRNVAVRWTSARSALVCLRATDLPDRGYRIEAGDPPSTVEVEQC